MIPLALLVAVLLSVQLWTAAAVFALPLALRVGYRTAVRRTGVGMVRAGTLRIVRWRL